MRTGSKGEEEYVLPLNISMLVLGNIVIEQNRHINAEYSSDTPALLRCRVNLEYKKEKIMKKMGLQLFAEAIQGKKIVYLYRIKKDAATSDGTLIAFTTENGRTKSKDADSIATKDGSIRTPGTAEVEITATSILSKGDIMIDKLEDAMDSDEIIEIWEANLAEPAESGDNKFKGMYFQGFLTEFEKTSSAEDFTECSLTFGINGSGKRGSVTVSVEQQEIADYVFADTQKTGSGV